MTDEFPFRFLGCRLPAMRANVFGFLIKSGRSQLISALWIVVAGCASGPAPVDRAAQSRYSHELHDRFYQAWVQPREVGLPRGKISVPVDVTIDRDGDVVSFKIAKPSGNAKIDRSIVDMGRRIRRVNPPPATSAGNLFSLRIFFELDVR